MRPRPIVTACFLAGIALLLYAFRLSAAPLTPQESAFSTHAHSIRAGWTPMFFRVHDEQWLQPAAVYANAAVRRVGGGEVSGRFASAVAAALDVAIVFLVAHLITNRQWIGVIAAVILMLTPAHWQLAQLGTDAIYPAPLVLLWLWSVLRFLKGDSLRSLATAAAALGASVHTHPAAPLTAAFLWLLTLVVARRRHRVRLTIATLIFIAMWMPVAYWFFRHPDTYADTYGRWVVFAAHLRSPLEGLASLVNQNTLGARASLYWGFWNPAWLFFGSSQSAPLLLVTMPLIGLGAYYCARHPARDYSVLLLATTVIVPVAGATFSVPDYIAAAAAVLPIMALVAALGAAQLAAWIRPRPPLVDGEDAGSVRGWDSDQLLPRS